jgi:hypothetical protein
LKDDAARTLRNVTLSEVGDIFCMVASAARAASALAARKRP